MDSDYLGKYYDLERRHWWFRVREKILLQQLRRSLPKLASLSILNVGVATGRTTEMMEPFGKITSVEIDHNTCKFLRDHLKMEVIEASVTALPFPDQCFDVICAFDVLEHVENDSHAMQELGRVCKAGGLLFITVPAFSFLWTDHDVINHHYRRYDSRKLRELIGPGFQVQYLSYFNSILFLPIGFYRMMRRTIPTKKAPQSDFAGTGILSNKIMNRFFEKVFNLEVFFLRYVKFPIGVSILTRIVKR